MARSLPHRQTRYLGNPWIWSSVPFHVPVTGKGEAKSRSQTYKLGSRPNCLLGYSSGQLKLRDCCNLYPWSEAMGNTLQKPQETEEAKEQEPEQEQQQEEVSNFTCEICIEPMPSNRKFKNGSFCIHPFCLDCIAKYIEVKVEGITGNIECPSLSCKRPLDPLSCRPFISKPVFEKWCDLLCDSLVLGFERCYCPYQDCSVLVLNECRNKLKKIKCPNCKQEFCFRCKIPWHAGYRCNESAQLRDRNDVLIGELIEEKKWTRCYGCGHSIERVSGCRDIKCKCGVRFCHQCGGRYHFGPCKHKCCGDFLFFLFILALFTAFFYFVYHQVQILSPQSK